ncbi:ribonuclease M5 [Mollicutes bacterium LVI A0078]|nr:ribonuclease M5 [Mollicutes bacterium LVI A0075]WOO91111.1 ribonuclease M5 [Mollicutes bacterium LVI A0078]
MKTIVIVEGKSDTRRLKEIFPDIITFQTSGMGLDDQKIAELKRLEADGVELICFTDPDYPGEKIRQTLSSHLPTLKHAYVSRDKSRAANGKIGIESAETEEIIKALEGAFENSQPVDIYDHNFMIEFGLTGNKQKRELFCDKIGIAFGNNKKVIKQLNSFGINPKLVMKVLGELDES